MKRLEKGNTFLMAVLALAATGAGGCGVDSPAPAPDGDSASVGRVTLPLVTTANEHTYRLSHVSIAVFGPEIRYLASSDDPAETELVAILQTGRYVAILSQWTLERDDGTGTFVPVPATLVSEHAVAFEVFNGAASTVGYRFRTDGINVVVGAGELRVKVAVDEVPSVCTPFGTDCAVGSWCPPTGLTGAERACIAEGGTALGQPCLRPAECVANATCADVGAGPVCVALCAPADFDAACPSGGTCQRAASDYGICTPSPELQSRQ